MVGLQILMFIIVLLIGSITLACILMISVGYSVAKDKYKPTKSFADKCLDYGEELYRRVHNIQED